MKIIKIAIAAVAIISIATSCEKKPKAPFGENVIRYKVNGELVEIKGKYNGLTNSGITFRTSAWNGFSYNFGGISAKNSYKKINITIPKNINSNVISKFDTVNKSSLTCYMPNTNGNLTEYSIIPNSSLFTIIENNSNLISGNFSGMVYYSDFIGIKLDSVFLSDGYFDVSKN